MDRTLQILLVWLLSLLVGQVAWAYDPMAPPGYETAFVDEEKVEKKSAKKHNRPNYILRQIVHRGDNRSAVINGYVVNEGTYLKNAYVKTISENSVVLSVSGRDKTLKLEAKLPKVRR